MAHPRAPRRPAAALAAVSLVLVALLASCSDRSSDGSGSTPTNEDRAAAIVRTRDEVVVPAQALGTSAAAVASRLEQLVARPDDTTIEAVRAAIADLREARADVEALALEPTTGDIRAAAASLDAAVAGAEALEDAAGAIADAAELAAEADEQLAEMVAAWDEPGSRSQLLARFQEVAADADRLASEGAGSAPETCPGPVEARQASAAFVAEATRELHDLVAQRDGVAFDERRAALDEAPYGVDDAGVPRGPGMSIDATPCPAVDDAEAGAADVVEALRALQQALNPPDLAG